MIELSRVGVRYRRSPHGEVLSGVDLKVDEGAGVVIRGPSGAGKSALAELLCAAKFADTGVVKLFDRDVAKLRRTSIELVRRRIGLLSQPPKLLSERTARDNVALALEVDRVARRQSRAQAVAVLGEFGLESAANVPVERLSQGERQRVAIARALVRDAQVIVLDDPSAHLDESSVHQLASQVLARQQGGASVCVCSSDLRLVAALRDFRHYELRCGQLYPADWARVIHSEVTPVAAGEIAPRISAQSRNKVVPFPMAAAGGQVE